MESLQILDRARTTEIESVLADADIACVIPLALRDVGELVFDHRALSQRGTSDGGLDLLTESMLQRLVLGDGHRATVPEFSGGALTSQGAAIADVGIELDDRAEGESLHLSIGTRNRAVAKIQRKRRAFRLAGTGVHDHRNLCSSRPECRAVLVGAPAATTRNGEEALIAATVS